MVPTQVFLLGKGLTGWDAPWAAAGLGDASALRSTSASATATSRRSAARSPSATSSPPRATSEVGDVVPARLEDTTKASLRVAAIYDRAAGWATW